MNIELHISDDLAHILASTYDDVPRAALESLALEAYRSGRISDGQVRQMLGFSSRLQVHAFLKQHGIPLNYSLVDLEADRRTSQGMEDMPGGASTPPV